MTKPIVVEQRFHAPVAKLWDAITKRDQMVQWYFQEIRGFEPRVGYRTEFTVLVDDRAYVHEWEVTEAVVNRRMSHTWRYRDIVGAGAVSWDLREQSRGSALRLTCTGIETFPQDDPAFTRESCENGWRYFINERLKGFVDGDLVESLAMSPSVEEIKKQLIEIIHARFAAFQNDDVTTLESHLTDDATLWDVFIPQLISGRDERRAFREADHQQMRARGKLTIDIHEPVIAIWPDVAIARYYLDFSYQPPNPASGTVRITDVFRNTDGRWLIVHHHEGLVPTGIPPVS